VKIRCSAFEEIIAFTQFERFFSSF
jgi:hypothetical protein